MHWFILAELGDRIHAGLREFGVAVVMLGLTCAFIFLTAWWVARSLIIPMRDAGILFLGRMANAQETIAGNQGPALVSLAQVAGRLDVMMARIEELNEKVDTLVQRGP